MKKILLLNNEYEIKEYFLKDENFMTFKKDLKSMKDNICHRKTTLIKDQSNINTTFIMKQLELIEKEKGFAYAIYQKIKIYDNISFKPTVILFCRYARKSNSLILTLICKFEGSTKGLSKILMNKLIEKAKTDKINYIYLESIPDARFFYKKFNFNSEDDKGKYTESEEDETLFGYVLELNKENKDNNNENQIGAGNNDINTYFYKLENEKLRIYDNNLLLIEIEIYFKFHPICSYLTFEIENLSNNNYIDLLINLIDLISENRYVKSVLYHVNDIELEKKILTNNYQFLKNHFNKDLNSKIYEKKFYQNYILDRTVLKDDNF